MFHGPTCVLGIVPVIFHSEAEIFSWDLKSGLLVVYGGVSIEIRGPSGCSDSPQLMEERLLSDGGISISGIPSPMLESSLSEPALALRRRFTALSGWRGGADGCWPWSCLLYTSPSPRDS